MKQDRLLKENVDLNSSVFGCNLNPKPKVRILYWILLLILAAVFCIAAFVKIDISASSRGIVRSPEENIAIESSYSGEIVEFKMSENKYVHIGDTLATIRSIRHLQQKELVEAQITQNLLYTKDLLQLTRTKGRGGLSQPLYQAEANKYHSQISDLEIARSLAKKEFETERNLFQSNATSEQSYLQAKAKYHSLEAQLVNTEDNYQSKWESDLKNLKDQYIELSTQLKLITEEEKNLVVRATVPGRLYQIKGYQNGSFIQSNTPLGYISNDADLLVECYVASKNIGYIRLGQDVLLQFDAFNYRDWGSLKSKVVEVLNDVIVTDGYPMFRVRCSLPTRTLRTKSGYIGKIGKGQTLTVQFYLNQRTLLQLLFDNIDNWLNPTQNLESK